MDKEQTAIMRLRQAAEWSERIYDAPLIVTTSGGKDSSVCVELALRAGINFEVQHNHTTADAPETVYFIRREFARLEDQGIKCSVSYPYYKGVRVSMWSLIPQKLMPPTRLMRYCCSVLKENGGRGRMITTGVRWAESVKRQERGVYEKPSNDSARKIIIANDNTDTRRLFEHCRLKAKRVCNPIIDWSDSEVWDFLSDAHIPVNPLYDCGFSRVGCVGCPMAGKKRIREFARWPKYEAMYIRAFDRMLIERQRRGKLNGIWRIGTTGRDVFHWWMQDGVLAGQISLEEYLEAMNEE